MKLFEAAGLIALSESHMTLPRFEQAVQTGTELAAAIWKENLDRGIGPYLGGCATSQKWAQRWLPSKRFRLLRMPLNAAALSCQPKTGNLVLKKIYAREDTPIVVDYNRNQVGRTAMGFTPQVIVIDGKHRFQAATLRGETHIMAWVGEQAINLVPQLRAMGGGGPAPERTTPAAGAQLVADALKKKKMKGQSGQETRLANRPGTFSAEGKLIKELDVDDSTGDASVVVRGRKRLEKLRLRRGN